MGCLKGVGWLLILLFSAGAAHASEFSSDSINSFFTSQNGSTIRLNDLYLQLGGRAAEEGLGGFMTPAWKLGGIARFTSSIDLAATVGASQLLYRPKWVAPSNSTIDLIEAKGMVRSDFVDAYAGQFLLPFGLEGRREEEDLYFPRTLLYEQGAFLLRDYGAGVTADSDGFYFDVAAHSGNGGGLQAASSNRVFVTGKWGFETPAGTGLGLSATEGRYVVAGSATESVLRGGNVFTNFGFMHFLVEMEASYFQTFVATIETDQLAWHGDFIFHLGEELNLLWRYEQYNPSSMVNSNILGRGTMGLEWHNKNSSSRLFCYLIKNNESLQEIPNDEIRLVWRFSPL